LAAARLRSLSVPQQDEKPMSILSDAAGRKIDVKSSPQPIYREFEDFFRGEG
jgi:hypothetical protein